MEDRKRKLEALAAKRKESDEQSTRYDGSPLFSVQKRYRSNPIQSILTSLIIQTAPLNRLLPLKNPAVRPVLLQ